MLKSSIEFAGNFSALRLAGQQLFPALSPCPSRTVEKSPSPAASGSARDSRALSSRHQRLAVLRRRQPAPRPARAERRHATALAGVSQSESLAGRRGYGTLGHWLFPAAASRSFTSTESSVSLCSAATGQKLKNMFDQLLLVLGAAKLAAKLAREIKGVARLDTSLLPWARGIPSLLTHYMIATFPADEVGIMIHFPLLRRGITTSVFPTVAVGIQVKPYRVLNISPLLWRENLLLHYTNPAVDLHLNVKKKSFRY